MLIVESDDVRSVVNIIIIVVVIVERRHTQHFVNLVRKIGIERYASEVCVLCGVST